MEIIRILPIADPPRISKPVTIAAVNEQISPRELNGRKRRLSKTKTRFTLVPKGFLRLGGRLQARVMPFEGKLAIIVLN